MRKGIVFVLLLAFLLAGCHPQTEPSTLGSAPTQTQDTTPTVPSTVKPTEPTVKPTEPTVLPTTPTVVPTEPKEEVDPLFAAALYSSQGFEYPMFVYKSGKEPYFEFESAVDLSTLKDGALYIHHKESDEIHLVTEDPWKFTATKEHVLYSEEEDPHTVLRCDLYGNESNVICRFDGVIKGIEYYGVDPSGKVIVLEDNRRVIMYDISTGTPEVVLEYAYIERAAYLINNIKDTRDYGRPHFFWYGKIEEDSEPSYYYTWLDNGEIVKLDPR